MNQSKQPSVEVDSTSELKVIFLPDAGITRMVKTFIIFPNKYRFFLYPIKSYAQQIGGREELAKDPSYDSVEDMFVKDIPKSWCFLANPHPAFQTWYVFCNWNLEFQDPFESKIKELTDKNKSLQDARDAYAEQVKSTNRRLIRFAKHPELLKTEIAGELAEQVKKFNPLMDKEA